MQSSSNSPSASSSSYYENSDFYGGGYNNYDQIVSSYQATPYHYQSANAMRTCDAYNGNRNPSNCPPAKQAPSDYQRRQTRYGMDAMLRMQIKSEPDPDRETSLEVDGENFTSLFTKSLTSLYSQDAENAFADDNKSYGADVMVCNPVSGATSVEDTGYQRLGTSLPQYSSSYQNERSNFGFYESRNEPTTSVVEELRSEGERTNAFRYDRPSFDDMHLYASSPNDSKSQTKKRKLSMPNINPEGNFPGSDNRKKTPRLLSFKSDSKWTPNSFSFSDVQIKQEPIDDYNTEDLDSQNRGILPFKDNSTGTSSKNSTQQQDHPKPVPRKRSPGATCFDRFEKKSTPTSKKVSPLSVYAKVQDSIVLSVKCRRYKKRTKPIVAKEELLYPGREEIENWKRMGAYSQSPDEAAKQVMGDLLERVCQINDTSIADNPDLMQVDVHKVKELLFQFCQRYSLDCNDFEDIESVLKPCIIKDKSAKNSERASAIRKRTSVSPVHPKAVIELVNKPPKSERGAKKVSNEAPKVAERRVLRKLPGRVDRGRQLRRCNKVPVVRRRYSTRSTKDVEEVMNSDVDIIIDSSTDRESEAGKEAEVRKKSQRLKGKHPVLETPAKDDKIFTKNFRNSKKDDLRSREKKDNEKLKDTSKDLPKKKSPRGNIKCNDTSQSSSVDCVDVAKNQLPASVVLLKDSREPISVSKSSEKSFSRTKSVEGRKSQNKDTSSSASSSKTSVLMTHPTNRGLTRRTDNRESPFVSLKKTKATTLLKLSDIKVEDNFTAEFSKVAKEPFKGILSSNNPKNVENISCPNSKKIGKIDADEKQFKISASKEPKNSENEKKNPLVKIIDDEKNRTGNEIQSDLPKLEKNISESCEFEPQTTQSSISQLNEENEVRTADDDENSKNEHSKDNFGKPPELVCMNESKEKPKLSEENRSEEYKSKQPSESVESHNSNTSMMGRVDEILNCSQNAANQQFSESEDSDCGLVIDLERRQSVEEQKPKEAASVDQNFDDCVIKKEKASPVMHEEINHIPVENTEEDDDCILLQPSDNIPSVFSNHIDKPLLESSFSALGSSHDKKMKNQERDESILRTLLLETGEIAAGTSQDILENQRSSSAISIDSKASINQDVMKLLMYQTYHEMSPCGSSPDFDEKKFPLDQLPTDINANLLSDSEEWSRDPRFIKEKIKKLKHEIVYLQCMAEQKDKERTAIVCFKRYKEEVLRRLIKDYAFNVQDHVRDWIRSRRENTSSESRSSSSQQQSSPSTSSQHPLQSEAESQPRMSPAHQVIQLAYHATVKTDVPTSVIATDSSKSPHCGEKLPTVEAMIAKATENYGVDMRTVKNSTTTTETILHKVLSSKEAIYSPTTCRSPSTSDQKTGNRKCNNHHQQQSLQIFQKTLSSTKESNFNSNHSVSPVSEVHTVGKSVSMHHPHLLQKVLTKEISHAHRSSVSPPSLQPELRPIVFSSQASSSQKQYPLDLIVTHTDSKAEVSKSFEVCAGSSKVSIETLKSTRAVSSPKCTSSNSYSAWSSVQIGRNMSISTSSIDLRPDHVKAQDALLAKKRPSTNGHTNRQGFMVVPPATTLQQSQKSNASSNSQQLKLDTGHHERSLKTSVEKIYSRKTEEERQTLSYSSLLGSNSSMPYVGHIVRNSVSSTVSKAPLPSTSNSSTPRCMGCGISDAKFLCSGCRKHWYCSAQCQTMRWPEHSRVCAGSLYNQSAGTSYS
ncbi:uncharacterized protein LOC118196809 [Stegodyphus dumicola]|uniref:uncharacterized protein LOC118196809 n=1 Tax=Stegodyphus dumicola TaxID=202533 RepID=UPI0015A9EF4D|nr:uncharacterized protein LOC118196809 [Stegodyphus dumicola]